MAVDAARPLDGRCSGMPIIKVKPKAGQPSSPSATQRHALRHQLPACHLGHLGCAEWAALNDLAHSACNADRLPDLVRSGHGQDTGLEVGHMPVVNKD